MYNKQQFGESAELNSVTKRFINSHIKDALSRDYHNRPYRLINALRFLRSLKDQWNRNSDPSTFEVADVLEPFKDDILKYLYTLFGKSTDNYIPVYQVAILTNDGVYWPEILELINSHKDAIVRRVLEIIKHGHHNDPDVEAWILALRAIGIDWRELDIIEKSHNANKTVQETELTRKITPHQEYMLKQIADDNFNILPLYLQTYSYPTFISDALDGKKQDILDYINSLIQNNRGWLHQLQLVYGLKHQGLYWPEFESIINTIKTPCIRYMLTIFKNMEYDKDDLEHIIKIVNTFIKLGVNWSELKIIKDTAETELDHIPPEEEEEEYDDVDDDYHGYREYD